MQLPPRPLSRTTLICWHFTSGSGICRSLTACDVVYSPPRCSCQLLLSLAAPRRGDLLAQTKMAFCLISHPVHFQTHFAQRESPAACETSVQATGLFSKREQLCRFFSFLLFPCVRAAVACGIANQNQEKKKNKRL